MKPDNIIPLYSDKSTRADAARNRRLLLDTAQRLFDEQEIEQVTMSEIAKEAGVGKGTLYRHFTDKSELCLALLDEDMRIFQRTTLQKIGQTDPVDMLRWFLRAAAEYTIRHSNLLREAANQGGVDTLRHPAHLWWRQTIVGLLNRIQPDGDTDYMADVLYIMVDVQAIRFQGQGQGFDVERIVAGLNMTLDKFIAGST